MSDEPPSASQEMPSAGAKPSEQWARGGMRSIFPGCKAWPASKHHVAVSPKRATQFVVQNW